MFEIIFLIAAALYFILSVIFFNGAGKRFRKIERTEFPYVSVIITARNEAENILKCLESLDNIDYPEDKLEIIVVDDDSNDSTGEIIDGFIGGRKKFKKLLSSAPQAQLKGKVNALAFAVKTARGEFILTTDADCTVPAGWVRTIVSYYDNNTGAVCGFAKTPASGWFEGMQAVDLSYLLIIASGNANINKPVSCIGNNMSFRKSAYTKAGGYENLPFSVTEDFQLLNAIHGKTNSKVIFPIDINFAVETKACPGPGDLYRQKKRWAVGGLNASAWGIFVMCIALLANYCLFLTPLFFTKVCLYLAVFKIAIDFFLLYPVHKQLGISGNLKYFLHFQIYYILYIVILPWILLFNRKVFWKGREY